MGHRAAKDVYRDLGRAIDGLTVRAPWSETLREILCELYTEEEAALVSRMPLADADKVVRLVAELPVAAVLHGHRHTAFRLNLPGAAGPTPVLCAGSASRVADEPVRRARAFLYEVDRGGLRNVETLVASVE